MSPADWWIWCVLAGHNLRDGKCLRCGERHDDEAAVVKTGDPE